jgi:hypothetical protein
VLEREFVDEGAVGPEGLLVSAFERVFLDQPQHFFSMSAKAERVLPSVVWPCCSNWASAAK